MNERDELHQTIPPPPIIDVRLTQLRVERERITQLVTGSTIVTWSDRVQIILTPDEASELFGLLGVAPDGESDT